MNEDIYIKFLFDYDYELGYTEKTIHIERDQIENINGKKIINLYGEFKGE